MFTSRRTVRIEWGDCDPAGIVFYPRYFAMFNHSTELLIERALGMKKYVLNQQYGLGGYPAVATQARFLLPTRYGDDVEIASGFIKIGRSSFSIQHKLSIDGALAGGGRTPPRRAGRGTAARRQGGTVPGYCRLTPSRLAIAASVLRCSSSEAAN